MCIGIPMQVVSLEGSAAWCEGRDGRQRIDLTLVGEQVPGTWLLRLMGAARQVMSAEAALHTDRALDALEGVLAGDASGIEDAFADLIGREPVLPAHLRKPETPA